MPVRIVTKLDFPFISGICLKLTVDKNFTRVVVRLSHISIKIVIQDRTAIQSLNRTSEILKESFAISP